MKEIEKERKRRRSRSRSRSRGRDEEHSRRHRSKRERSESPSRYHSKERDKSSRRGRERKSPSRSGENADKRSSRPQTARNVTEESEAKRQASDEKEKDQQEKAKAAEIASLDEEMRKRRERVRAWQEARAKAQGQQTVTEDGVEPAEKKIDEIETEEKRPSEQAASPSLPLPVPAEASEGIESEGSEEIAADVEEEEEEEKPRWTLEDDDEDAEAVIEEVEVEEGDGGLPTLPSGGSSLGQEDEETASSAFAKLSHPPLHPAIPASKPLAIPTPPLAIAKKPAAAKSAVLDPTVDDDDDDGRDPLDAFMDDLLQSGAVAEQKGLKAVPIDSVQHPAPHHHTSSVVGVSSGSVPGGDGNTTGGASEEGADEYEGINFHGSNTITMEEILAMRGKRGWESDAAESASASPTHLDHNGYQHSSQNEKMMEQEQGNEQEDEGEEEDGERERQEFIAAFRKAREEEEIMREKLLQTESRLSAASQATVSTPAVEKGERSNGNGNELGRVFASEGDIVEEEEVENKKRSALEVLEEAKRGKMLKEVDHSKISYLPIRKNLYIAPRALARLTEEEIGEKRESLQVKVRGKGCPAPVDSWEQCGLSDRILLSLTQYGMYQGGPFPIQAQAIPAIMCGRDVIGVAKTGSGKTLAFLLPMLRHIQDQPPLVEGDGPIGLVLAPARELACQIYQEAKKFTKNLAMRVACVYGGAGVAEQIADLKRLSEIVVCTPGRLIDLLTMQAGRMLSLRRVSFAVLDEADRMLDMGFEPQIRMIMQTIRPDRQTVLFSATFPRTIEKLAKGLLRFPVEIIVGERTTVNKDIQQLVEIRADDQDKFLRLLQLLGEWYDSTGQVLIFVDKQEKADGLYLDLTNLGYPCLSLHGGKDQVDRDHTLHEFKAGKKRIMVATSVAGRGLDVPAIVLVINFNCPNHLEDYVHRVGRTGRAGRKGVAYTFLTEKDDQYAHVIIQALKKSGQSIPPDLQNLAQAFQEKVGRGEARFSSNGFVGTKGYKFVASEMNEAQRAKLVQKQAYEAEQGLTSSSAAEGLGEDDFLDQEEQEEVAGSRAVSSTPSVGATSTTISAPTAAVTSGGGVDAQAALARARLIAQQLLRGAGGGGGGAGIGGGDAAATSQPDYFFDELEINDYPVQARKKVTNRNTLDEITEATGCAIIARGTFQPPGRSVSATAGVNDRRLHLLIEGTSEMSVRQAKLEISRLLEEETMKLAGGVASSVGGGRYSVL
eukprot:gene9070-10009_t